VKSPAVVSIPTLEFALLETPASVPAKSESTSAELNEPGEEPTPSASVAPAETLKLPVAGFAPVLSRLRVPPVTEVPPV
jgi:hypothetical protein